MADPKFDDHIISNNILYDQDGNPIGALLDGYIYRLQVEAQLAPGASVSVGSTIPDDIGRLFRQKVTNGGSDNLRVNGSVTPVEFTVNADPAKDLAIDEIRFVLTANNIKTNGGNFGPISLLANGLLLEVTSLGVTTTVANVKLTEDFFRLYSPGGVNLDRTGASDILSAGLFFGGAVILEGGTADQIKVTVRDNLSSAQFNYFTVTVHGVLQL
jgi:hypothetical protein